jgi:hypothetical protein
MLIILIIVIFVFRKSTNKEGIDERNVKDKVSIDIINKHFKNKDKLAILESNYTSIINKLKIANQDIISNGINSFNISKGGLFNEWN